MQKPFNFLKVTTAEDGPDLNDDDIEDLEEQAQGDHQYHKEEKEFEKQFDGVAERVAQQVGYRYIPWLGISYVAVIVQMLLVFLTQYHRTDFVTLTACVMGFFCLHPPQNQNVRRRDFRFVVAFIFVSLVYDVAWFIINNDVEDDGDGGVERGIKRFARNISYISFVWKVSPYSSIFQLLNSPMSLFRLSLHLFSGKTLLTSLQL